MSMTINFKNSDSCNFRKIFYFFAQYCEVVSKRGTEYSELAVTIATSFIFDFLRVEWVDVEELKYLCLAMDNSPDELNSNNFIYCQAAFLDELKNYYRQNHG